MRDWLLSDDIKNKVGRPKLADSDILKRARISICFCICLCLALLISFASVLKNESPIKLFYNITFEKTFGSIQNKNGFIVDNYYENGDLVLNIKPSSNVKSYQGKYKYTLYKLTKNEWQEEETKTIENNSSFKIHIKSSRNKNTTWKVKLQMVNAAKIDKSFAPGGWKYVDSDENENKYAYNIFTVKGYYSPVKNEEIKEAKENDSLVSVNTNKENPRNFIVTVPSRMKIEVKYTDSSKIIKLEEKEIEDIYDFEVPNMDKYTNVTINVYDSNIEDKKLNNWTLSEDGKYITNTYLLKPEKAYKN